MINLIKIILAISLATTLNYSMAQEKYAPKVINTTSEYIHSTGLKFPIQIKEFSRKDITSLDSNESNIGITYINVIAKGRTQFTVYIYPDTNAYENRLRVAFQETLRSIKYLTDSAHKPSQHLYPFESNRCKINGLKAEINNIDRSEYNYLTVFECGKWMMKFRLTSDFEETKVLDGLQQELLQLFNPTDLVKRFPFKPKAEILLSDNSMNDKVLLRSIMFAGFIKIGWVENHIDSFERCSGFPGLYLEEHTGPLEMMVDVWKKSKESRKESTDEYMIELNSIIKNGFLDEFVMEQYNMLLFTPTGLKFDFDKFKDWKTKNQITIDLRHPAYIIKYTD